jgi:beta-glucanase (GH16 family)
VLAQPQTGCVQSGGPQTVNEPYVSGMVNTRNKFSYTYGFLEARVWLPGSPWAGVDWPGVWEVGSPAPQNGEIDLVEGLGGQACWHFHDPTGNQFGSCLGGWDGAWHTFGVDWEPGSITWYYDGTPVGTATTNVTGAPMYLIADLALDSQWGGPISAPATMQVDYIRVWQH